MKTYKKDLKKVLFFGNVDTFNTVKDTLEKVYDVSIDNINFDEIYYVNEPYRTLFSRFLIELDTNSKIYTLKTGKNVSQNEFLDILTDEFYKYLQNGNKKRVVFKITNNTINKFITKFLTD